MFGKPKEERDAATRYTKEELLAVAITAISTNEVKGKRDVRINYYF